MTSKVVMLVYVSLVMTLVYRLVYYANKAFVILCCVCKLPMSTVLPSLGIS